MPIYDACAAGVTLLGGSGDTGNGVAAYRAGVGSRSPISSGQQAAPVPGAGSGALHTGHGSGPQHDKLLYHLERYYGERVQNRKSSIRRTIGQVVGIVQDLLKEVESQEPRFISSLTEINNHYDGLQVRVGADGVRGERGGDDGYVHSGVNTGKVHCILFTTLNTFTNVLRIYEYYIILLYYKMYIKQVYKKNYKMVNIIILLRCIVIYI